MENPFYRKTYSSRPRPRPGLRSPKVVSVPIQFVSSEKTRSDAAVRIQKVYKGFLVRKSVRKIAAIKRELEEIERKVLERETAEVVRRDAKERLRMNEMVMALLLRLDSVRGVGSGVRECRKVVIRKAIALQEKLDAIVEEKDQSDQAKVVDDDDENEDKDGDEGGDNGESAVEDAIDDQECAMEAPVESFADATDEITEKANLDSETELGGEENSADAQPLSIHCNDETENVEASPERNCKDHAEEEAEKEEEHEMEIELEQKLIEESERRESSSSSSVMMERMLKDNEKLMGLVSQLCERNAMQTQMISSLSQRVENLEKAFICEKLRRKKKKRNTVAEKQDCTPDARKCGRKL
ncbi:hypothetical protein Sjap_023245 [Stephania japonica]|uniref:BAG domain-containing protein n=1 Tax=Stephania japonica TaxID=461633 RepID=A0AAP0EII1_9MAGN